MHSRGLGPAESSSNLSPHMKSLLADASRDFDSPEPASDHVPGQFILSRIIGKGGFGEVWEARQSRLNRLVAVKRLRQDLTDSGALAPGETLEKIHALRLCSRQEALTTANLEHPNIIPVHDLGTAEDGSPLIALKYIKGKPWDELIFQDHARLDPGEFLNVHINILIQMTQAVAFAHARGVIHRDLKPSQVIVGEFGEVLLADWGLAVVTDAERLAMQKCDERDFLPTPENASNPAGTPAFMAPEQTDRDGGGLGTWTDVYLLGGTLYFLLTLRPPHGGATARDAFMRARLGEVLPPEERAPGRPIPPGLAELAMRAMEVDPKDRIGSAADFLAELKKFQLGDSDRRESIAIAESISIRTEKEEDSYQKYADILAELSKAQGLWKGNPHLPPLFDRARAKFCMLAISKGDLALARLQADSITEERRRTDCVGRVAKAEKEIARRESHRFWAISLVWILVFFCITVFAVYQRNLIEERSALDLARNEAMVSQKQTLDLIESMMADLQQRLEPAQQLGSLRAAAYDVVAFLKTVRPQSPDMQSLVLESLAETHMRIALIEKALGDSSAALAALAEYRSSAEDWREFETGNTYAAGLLLNALILEGFVLSHQGRFEESEARYLDALRLATRFEVAQASVATPSDVEAATFLSNVAPSLEGISSFGELEDRNISILAVLDAVRTLEGHRRISNEEERKLWFMGIGLAYFTAGEVFASSDRWDAARRAFDRSVQVLEVGTRTPDGGWLPMEEWPWDNRLMFAFRARNRIGEAYHRLDDPALAESTWLGLLELINEGEIATENLAMGPRGAGWKSLATRAHQHLALLYLGEDLWENALSEARAAAEESRRVLLSAPDNPEALRGDMISRHVLGTTALNSWRVSRQERLLEEAVTAHATAVALSARLAQKDPLNVVWRGDGVNVRQAAAAAAESIATAGFPDVAFQIRDSLAATELP